MSSSRINSSVKFEGNSLNIHLTIPEYVIGVTTFTDEEKIEVFDRALSLVYKKQMCPSCHRPIHGTCWENVNIHMGTLKYYSFVCNDCKNKSDESTKKFVETDIYWSQKWTKNAEFEQGTITKSYELNSSG